MPTKFLVVETPTFQLGANAGEGTERVEIAAFPARLKQHLDAAKGGATDVLFVLAPTEMSAQSAYAEAIASAAPLSVALFASANDAIRFLPSLLLFGAADRSDGAKEYLAKGSTVFTETFFDGKSVGAKLDPCFQFARSRLDASASASVWGCLQSLVFLGLQYLPEVGEKGSGEKVDVQLGADEKLLAFTVRFDLPADKLSLLRAHAILNLPRTSAGVLETRYLASGGKIEINCLFFRNGGNGRTIEITSYQHEAALQSGAEVKEYTYRTFNALAQEAPAPAKKGKGKGGFKRKFSEQVSEDAPPAENAPKADVSGPVAAAGTVPDAPVTPKLTVSGSASLAAAPAAAVKIDPQATLKITELEAKIKSLEAIVKARDEALEKASKDNFDPLKRRDVLAGLKDNQSEALKQQVKALEEQIEELKKREGELMGMVDKAVQMKEDAAKKIKELDHKVKAAAANGPGSKVTMLERALDEQKRQNKELSKRVSELNEKLRAA